MKVALALAALLLPLPAGAQSAARYRLDARGTSVVEVSGMGFSGCSPGRSPIRGKVASRTFQDNGLLLSGFVVETPDGERTYLNTSPELDGLSAVDRGWIVKGLQLLTRVGSRVTVDASYCGAAGRVVSADRLRPGG